MMLHRESQQQKEQHQEAFLVKMQKEEAALNQETCLVTFCCLQVLTGREVFRELIIFFVQKSLQEL